MSGDRKYIEYLLLRYLENKCSDSERQRLFQYLEEEKGDKLENMLEEVLFAEPGMTNYRPEEWQPLLDDIRKNRKGEDRRSPAPVHRLSVWKRSRWWAAAVILLVATSYFIFNNRRDAGRAGDALAEQTTGVDIAPGTNKAILTRADGTTIVLDSAAVGTLSVEGNAKVVKLANGEVAYITDEQKTAEVLYNTMTTPRGGQYQLTLPDGTKVWLNAASSITYPTAFTGSERNVRIDGEAYFEVTKNAKMPFHVQVKDMTVEVLGTHFNVNAYTDEDAIKTTLLEGSVKIVSGDKGGILKPGDQGQLSRTAGSFRVINNADVEEAVAWKNGNFYFNGADIETIMRQVARWYDVSVTYENGIPHGHYKGKPSRNLTLSQMLKVVEYSGLKFRIEKNRIVVM